MMQNRELGKERLLAQTSPEYKRSFQKFLRLCEIKTEN